MNISELKSSYKANPGPNSGKSLAMLQYIEDLASRTSTNIESWDASIFTKEGAVIGTKTKINQIFFERKDQASVSVVQEVTELSKELSTSLNKYNLERHKKAVDALAKKRDECTKEAEKLLKDAAEQLKQAHTRTIDLQILGSGKNTVFGDEVMELLRDGLLTFESFDGQVLTLITNDIINTEVNPTAKLDLRVNLGQFKITVDIKTMETRILRHKNNIVVSSHYHPHVGSGGSLCQGNASASYAQYSAEGKIRSLLQLVVTILQTYNPSNPYVPLAKFHELSPRKEDRYRVEEAKADVYVGKGAAPVVKEEEDDEDEETEECEDCGESMGDCSC